MSVRGPALKDAIAADAAGNVTHGDVILEDSSGCYVYSESRLVATVGLKDHIVVETKDAVLVVPRDRVQDVKTIVSRLKQAGRYEAALHREVYRPWGSYDGIDAGERFQVKRLTVKPGASMSLQMHHHRAEHWIVVEGTARITRGEEIVPARGKPVDLHPDRHAPSHRKPRKNHAADDRSAVRARTSARTTSCGSRTSTAGSPSAGAAHLTSPRGRGATIPA